MTESTLLDTPRPTSAPTAQAPREHLDARSGAGNVTPQACACGGSGGDGPGPVAEAPDFVYAIGRMEPRFPSLAVEKEFAQAMARMETAGQTDQQSMRAVLSDRQNRYLARQVCWVFMVQGMETYLLRPRDPLDLDLFINALRPSTSGDDIDVVIGVRGPMAPPQVCNGLMVPMVLVDNLYAFHRDALVQAVPRPDGIAPAQFDDTVQALFNRVMQLTDNAGATHEHRALNYLAMRYPAVYTTVAECHQRDNALTGVEVRPSRLSGTRKVMDVVFSLTHRKTDVTEKYFTRVDVSEEFPFLVTKMSPYFDR